MVADVEIWMKVWRIFEAASKGGGSYVFQRIVCVATTMVEPMREERKRRDLGGEGDGQVSSMLGLGLWA